MSPVFDHAQMFISTGNLTKTATHPSSGIKIRGTAVSGLGVRIVFPSTPGTAAQVLPTIHASDNNSTYRLVSTYPGGAQSWASGGKELVFGFVTSKKYVKLTFTVTGGTTGTSWGAAKAGIVEGVGFDWSRAVDFS